MKIQRSEYPRPQFARDEWISLNGEWQFDFGEMDVKSLSLSKVINVPFSYQWQASGINDKSVHDTVWYRRTFTLNKNSKRALLCFNAADYETDVWINGYRVISHVGGFTPFKTDITDYVTDSENEIIVRCKDTLDTAVPRGKQSWTGEPFSCFYYPNTGIWGSVWIEFFGEDCIDSYSLNSDIDKRTVYGHIESMYAKADEAEITLKFKDKVLKKQRLSLDGKRTEFNISFADNAFDFDRLLWSTDTPNLIYVDFKLLKEAKAADVARARIGLRKISIEHGKICLNNRPLFQRLVLDQGYWDESGLTPPSAEALKKDIMLSKAMGFNGARKHQKLEDPYYYYYADELGFLVWAEMPSAYTFCDKEVSAITQQWQEIVNVAKNFTSVIAYVPLNESWGAREIKTDKQQQSFAKSLYYLTKSLDNTRLISTNDGLETVEASDVLGIHDYDVKQADEFPTKYNNGYDGLYPQGWSLFVDGHKYKGQPAMLTEFGGIALVAEQKGEAWGYGNGANDADDLCSRLSQLITGISQTEFQGYCYTQLTDVQQEVNGLLRSDRASKADLNTLKKIFEN